MKSVAITETLFCSKILFPFLYQKTVRDSVISTPFSLIKAVKTVLSVSFLKTLPFEVIIDASYILFAFINNFISSIKLSLICDCNSSKLSKVVLQLSLFVNDIDCSVILASKYNVGAYSLSSIMNVSPISASI